MQSLTESSTESSIRSGSDELLTGAEAIAEYLGPDWNRRRVYYCAEKGYLPIRKLGKRMLIARPSQLDAATRVDGWQAS